MIILKAIPLIISVLFVFVGAIMLIKDGVNYRNYEIIMDAIFDYSMDAIDKAAKNGTIFDGVKYEVTYSDMRDYSSTVMRIFDWGYKNILPADKFEIIKPYIHK